MWENTYCTDDEEKDKAGTVNGKSPDLIPNKQ